MQIILITGIAGVEKRTLTRDMAAALRASRRVAVIDNSETNPMPPGANIRRVVGDVYLAEEIRTLNADVVLVNLAESTTPERLEMIGFEVEARVLAVVDDRTCDCFPHLHAQLEASADLTLRHPFKLEDALAIVD